MKLFRPVLSTGPDLPRRCGLEGGQVTVYHVTYMGNVNVLTVSYALGAYVTNCTSPCLLTELTACNFVPLYRIMDSSRTDGIASQID